MAYRYTKLGTVTRRLIGRSVPVLLVLIGAIKTFAVISQVSACRAFGDLAVSLPRRGFTILH